MKRIVLLVFLACASIDAQPLRLDMSVFAERRKAFMEKMEPFSIALLPSKPEYMRNRDIEYDYRQESNFYYLSGFEEPDAILMLAPANPRYKFVMFVRKRDPRRETFDGPRAGIDGAMNTFGADTALYIDDLEISVYPFVKREGMLYYPFGINPDIDERIQKRFSSDYWHITNPYPVLAEMRLIKRDSDWKMGLGQAIDISVKAHVEVMKSILPEKYEYEIQGLFEYVYRKNGSPRNAYPCIVGSGPNSCILHYNRNARQMKAGELVLMDCAAEYGYYAADVSRTVPVSGKFSKEQRTIYQMVFDAQNAAINIIRPGVEFKTISAVIDSVLSTRLMDLKFIKDKKDFRLFALHGYSHWIGLDVHDVGEYTKNGESRILEPGMVLTIEPGIYVRQDIFERMKEKGYSESELKAFRPVIAPYMDIGVRIEDDIAVTERGCENLSARAPREIESIENLMKQKKD